MVRNHTVSTIDRGYVASPPFIFKIQYCTLRSWIRCISTIHFPRSNWCHRRVRILESIVKKILEENSRGGTIDSTVRSNLLRSAPLYSEVSFVGCYRLCKTSFSVETLDKEVCSIVSTDSVRQGTRTLGQPEVLFDSIHLRLCNGETHDMRKAGE